MREKPIVSDVWYHVYNRGVSKETIFHQLNDYERFLNKLTEAKKTHNISCLAYCLMPNHFHLLVKQAVGAERAISSFMHCLQMAYSKYYNGKYAHSGAVFQGAYKAKPVQTDEYLIALMNYIHSNPTKDGLTKQPDAWTFSSYSSWKQGQTHPITDINKFPLSGSYISYYQSCYQLPPTPGVDTRC